MYWFIFEIIKINIWSYVNQFHYFNREKLLFPNIRLPIYINLNNIIVHILIIFIQMAEKRKGKTRDNENKIPTKSSSPTKELTNECAWVPLTGIPNNLPARTLLVPWKPESGRLVDVGIMSEAGKQNGIKDWLRKDED